MRHFVDSRLQPLPGKGSFLPLMGELISMRIGRNKDGRRVGEPAPAPILPRSSRPPRRKSRPARDVALALPRGIGSS
jgi:hypothetical protein